MPKMTIGSRYASNLSWVDWAIIVAGCLAWALALGFLAALLHAISG